jgi:hypothetical protein
MTAEGVNAEAIIVSAAFLRRPLIRPSLAKANARFISWEQPAETDRGVAGAR